MFRLCTPQTETALKLCNFAIVRLQTFAIIRWLSWGYGSNTYDFRRMLRSNHGERVMVALLEI